MSVFLRHQCDKSSARADRWTVPYMYAFSATLASSCSRHRFRRILRATCRRRATLVVHGGARMSVERAQQRYEHLYCGQTTGEFTRRLQTALQHELRAQQRRRYVRSLANLPRALALSDLSLVRRCCRTGCRTTWATCLGRCRNRASRAPREPCAASYGRCWRRCRTPGSHRYGTSAKIAAE